MIFLLQSPPKKKRFLLFFLFGNVILAPQSRKKKGKRRGKKIKMETPKTTSVKRNSENAKPDAKALHNAGVNMVQFQFTDNVLENDENSDKGMFLQQPDHYQNYFTMAEYPMTSDNLCVKCGDSLIDPVDANNNKVPIFLPREYIPSRNCFIFLPFVFCSANCCKCYIVYSQRDLTFMHVTLSNFAEYMRIFFNIGPTSIPLVSTELDPRRVKNSPYKTVEEYEKARTIDQTAIHHGNVLFVKSSMSFIENINKKAITAAEMRKNLRNQIISQNLAFSQEDELAFQKKMDSLTSKSDDGFQEPAPTKKTVKKDDIVVPARRKSALKSAIKKKSQVNAVSQHFGDFLKSDIVDK